MTSRGGTGSEVDSGSDSGPGRGFVLGSGFGCGFGSGGPPQTGKLGFVPL